MKIETKTTTVATNITLTNKEIDVLVSAQKLVDRIWDALDDADTIENSLHNIYSAINDIGTHLNYIANFADIED